MKINFEKANGLVPAIIQNADTGSVLMLGYMNEESLVSTQSSGRVTFFSRSRQSLWTKGETSGNFLSVVEILPDCDSDALLIRVRPEGATCHRGTDTCFEDELGFLHELESIIEDRFTKQPEGSYVAGLVKAGLDRIAQKVGEEAIETVIAAKNIETDKFNEEAADLVFHLMVLLRQRGSSLGKVCGVLRERHRM